MCFVFKIGTSNPGAAAVNSNAKNIYPSEIPANFNVNDKIIAVIIDTINIFILVNNLESFKSSPP